MTKERVLDEDTLAEMNRWLGLGVPRAESRRTLHRVAGLVRDLAQAVVRVDAEAAEPADLDGVAAGLAEIRDVLADLPRLETTPAAAPLPASYLFERSPVSGASNPVAAPLTVRFGSPTTAEAVYTEQYEGPAGGVHGGVVAAAFDEVLGIAQMASGIAGYTGTLEVRYLAVTPLHQRIRYEAGVDRLDGRKLHMWARSTAAGRLCAEARGVFVARERLP